MTPELQAAFREIYAADPNLGAQIATADAMIQGILRDQAGDAAALIAAFSSFSPNLMPLLDSPEGVAVLATAMAAMTGISTTYEPTRH
jgi:hypothetical protein